VPYSIREAAFAYIFSPAVRTGVNLTSYAELAVRLVNSAFQAPSDPDPLGASDTFGVLVSDRPHLTGAATAVDLTALRALRTDLAAVFAAAATGRDAEAAGRLNAVLARSSVQPELISHDDQAWHVHLADTGSVADRYAAGAAIGLSLIVSQLGFSRLGTCSIASCHRVFIDASPGRSRRYCAEHGASRPNVTAIRAQARPSAPAHAGTAAS
jgi:predicted RNA-binding Zn ribbon-like protein